MLIISHLTAELKKYWWCYALLIIYFVIVSVVTSKHEMWFDEVHAWQIVKHNDLGTLLFDALRYEGHTPLWYLILFIPAKLGFAVSTLQIISALIGTACVALILRFTRLNIVIKILLPFSYFIAYQYTVVARNYGLLFLCLILASITYRNRFKRPAIYCFTLALIALAATQGILLAMALFIYFCAEIWQRNVRPLPVFSFAIFVVCISFLFLVLFPRPTDGISTADPGVIRTDKITYVVSNLGEGLLGNSSLSFLWLVLVISCAAYAKKDIALIGGGMMLLAIFFAVIYMNIWHSGIFFLAIICCYIIYEFDTKTKAGITANALMVCLLVIQVSWTVVSYSAEINTMYSGMPALANYIITNDLEDKEFYALGDFNIFAIFGYIDKNIFVNLDSSVPVFKWSSQFGWNDSIGEYIEGNYLIASDREIPIEKAIPEGSNLIATFPGKLIWKGMGIESETFYLYDYINK